MTASLTAVFYSNLLVLPVASFMPAGVHTSNGHENCENNTVLFVQVHCLCTTTKWLMSVGAHVYVGVVTELRLPEENLQFIVAPHVRNVFEQQASASSHRRSKPLCGDTMAPSVALNGCRAHLHHLKQVACHFEPPSPFYGPFGVQK